MGFSSDDRAIIETLFALSTADQMLAEIPHYGAWSRSVADLRDNVQTIIHEMAKYLDDMEDMDD